MAWKVSFSGLFSQHYVDLFLDPLLVVGSIHIIFDSTTVEEKKRNESHPYKKKSLKIYAQYDLQEERN